MHKPPGTGLFDQQTILDITLSGNLKDMMGDRSDDPKLYPITLSYKGDRQCCYTRFPSNQKHAAISGNKKVFATIPRCYYTSTRMKK